MRTTLGVRVRVLWVAIVVVANAVVYSFSGTAKADPKVALVVGNGAYQNVPALANPPNDAADVAAALLRLGFSVRLVLDASYETARLALLEFNQKARDAEMAVVFFAGHGMEVNGENWLIPVDAQLKSDTDTEQEAVSLRGVMQMVSSASKLGLVVLDACRNNPFSAKMKRTIATRAISRGLVRIEPANNVLVAYAAKDGTTAGDGDGRNSPFTAALLKHLETPGLEVNFLFRNIRDDVIAATKGDQQPFIYGSLAKDAIYLKPPAVVTPSSEFDQIAWALIKETTDEAAFKRFIAQFPHSSLRENAEARIVALAAARVVPQRPDELTWLFLKETTDEAALKRFVTQYPNNTLRAEAETRIALLAAQPPKLTTGPPDRHELIRSLQVELKRIGCFTGAVDGEFNDSTRAAAKTFVQLSAINIPDDLTLETIKSLQRINKRICPLVCPDGERAADGRCVRAEARHEGEPRQVTSQSKPSKLHQTNNFLRIPQRGNQAENPKDFPAPNPQHDCSSGLISFCH
jgi:hypothetical protein